MYLWSLVAVTHLRYSILTDKFVEFRLLADFLMIEMSVLWMNMQIVNMNVYRHRYWNLCSLLPLSVTHHHTAFLIFPDAPTVQLFKTPKGLGSNWREFYGDPTFLASWTSTYQRLLLQDNFSILQFFFLKVLQHIHLCMFESTAKILETPQQIEANFHHFPPRLRCMRPFVVMWPVWSSWSKAAHKWIRRWQFVITYDEFGDGMVRGRGVVVVEGIDEVLGR